jgi:PAS domain S-box-containing protein
VVVGDYQALLQGIVSRVTWADGCGILLLSEDGARIAPAAVAMWDEEATAAASAALLGSPEREAESTAVGLAMQVVRTGEPLLMSPLDPEALASQVALPTAAAWIRQVSIRGLILVPMRAGGATLGVLALLRKRSSSSPFDVLDLDFAQGLADHVALAVSNARLVASLRRELDQRRAAQEEARTFVALVETSSDFIAMASLEGQVLYVNAAGRRLLGLDPDADVRAMKLGDFHTRDGLARAAIIRERGWWQGEGVLRHFKTGEMIPTRVCSFIARGVEGEPVCFATVQSDLRETRRLEAQLRQAQKMEAVGQLAGGVAHDFNNLLSIILSYTSLIAAELPEGSAARADLGEIEAAGQRAAALTRQLLAVGRQQVLQPRVLDLRQLVKDMWRLFRGTLSEDIELRSEMAGDLAQVWADQGQLEQVLLNLVVNARDAMSDGGVLTISASNATVVAGDQVTADGLEPGLYVVLAVTDTGTGMDDATRARIFEPFFTTKGVGKGTGLGLSTALGIVKQSGGHIVVESAPGKGTSFRVYLQRHGGVAGLAQPAPVAAARGAGGHEVILVVEDERSVRALTCRVLRGAGYQVHEADGAEEALRASGKLRSIDLLLTDVVMPIMGGRELATRLVTAHPETSVLYFSGYSEDALGPRGILDPGIELLRKPITPAQLLEKVRQVLDRRSLPAR